MSQDSEKLKALVNFKEKLEKRIEELDAEMKEASATLEAVNSVLLEKGFKRGDIKEVKEPKEEAPPAVDVTVKAEKPAEPESVIPLKTMDDEPLGLIYVANGALHHMPG